MTNCKGCQGRQERQVNVWNAAEVERQEKMWGRTCPDRILDIFKASLEVGDVFLDLGCGFGRYLEFLDRSRAKPFQYIGYDSSPDMVARIKERFPDYASFIYQKDVTQSIHCTCDVVVASALFIHLTIPEQKKILTNIHEIAPKPKFIGFNINSPSEDYLLKNAVMERISAHGFRMVWQSQYETLRVVLKMFGERYSVTMKSYGTDGMSAKNDSFSFILNLRE